jgi:hypothetical protein
MCVRPPYSPEANPRCYDGGGHGNVVSYANQHAGALTYPYIDKYPQSNPHAQSNQNPNSHIYPDSYD